MSEAAVAKPSVWQALRQRKVLAMLGLGFASGLPFYLVGNTLGYWLREYGVALSAIGFLSWVGLAYSFKFLWAPLMDRTSAPGLGFMGARRGWMLLAQVLVLLGLAGMAWWQPSGGLTQFALLALLVAFASATQDIVIDAWRIESAANGEEQGLLTSTAQLGYRGALLVTDSLILIFAAWQGWAISYWLMAALMGLGIAATLLAAEPTRHAPQQAAIWSARGLFDAVVGPFVDFFRTHRQWALLMLVAVSVYRLPDFMMGPMANPFYADLGLAKEVVGGMRSSIGLVATLIGIAAGGLAAVRLGFVPTLLLGAVLGPASNLAFTAMALLGPSLKVFAVALSIDNFATGFAGAALVAYMSSLTTQGYTITQYALLSSFYALPGKFLKGFSGALVEYWQAIYGAMGGYAAFFAFTAVLGLPALLLVGVLAKQLRGSNRE